MCCQWSPLSNMSEKIQRIYNTIFLKCRFNEEATTFQCSATGMDPTRLTLIDVSSARTI